MRTLRPWLLVSLLPAALLAAGTARGQAAASTLRITLLPQWVVNQHRASAAPGRWGEFLPVFRDALEGGVVDRVVFQWQRGAIQRQALVTKPIRAVADPEAAGLGGRGTFEVVAVRPPAGRAAWTEVDIVPRSAGPDAVLVLEVGGERNTVTQVLETLLVQGPGGRLQELALVRPALIPAEGVPVVTAAFGVPVVPPGGPGRFREVAGLALLVARSPVEVVRNGEVTVNGPADAAPLGTGDWREGDRVFIRMPLAVLRAGAPALVLGWKDRTLQPDPDAEFPRRSSLPLPLVR